MPRRQATGHALKPDSASGEPASRHRLIYEHIYPSWHLSSLRRDNNSYLIDIVGNMHSSLKEEPPIRHSLEEEKYAEFFLSEVSEYIKAASDIRNNKSKSIIPDFLREVFKKFNCNELLL